MTSLVWNLYPLLEQMVKDMQAGEFRPGKFYSLGIAEGGLEVAVNPDLKDHIPERAFSEIETVQEEVAAGAFEIPYIPE